jgi:hypothetical protein
VAYLAGKATGKVPNITGSPTSGWWWQRWLRCGGGSGQSSSREGGKGKKNNVKMVFFSTLASYFSFLRTWNHHLFIGVGRGMFGLYWYQILVLGST